MRRRPLSKKRQREHRLSQLKYPHYSQWKSKRHLLKRGAVLQLGNKTLQLEQVIRPVIAGDTPSLVLVEKAVEKDAEKN